MKRTLPLLTALLALACTPDEDTSKDTPTTDVVADTDVADTDIAADTDLVVPADTDDTDVVDTDPPSVSDCFAATWGPTPPVNYSSIIDKVGTHCNGTNHQDITGVERVVFIGDSVTLGTLPTPTNKWWRNQVADQLVARFGLAAPNSKWRNADLFNGVSLQQKSGDFQVCAKYGARTDDLLDGPHYQIQTCMPEEDRGLKTLVIMTIGGNDIYSLLEDVNAQVDDDTLRETYKKATDLFRAAIEWIVAPGRFPNGVYVVFGNTYDFTDPDGAEEMAQCEGAQLLGLDRPLRKPIFQEIIKTAQEGYLQLAVDTHTDMFFLGEAFCGHGYNAGDTNSRCYRGPGAATWFDFTCEHPNLGGHNALTNIVMSVITE